MTSAPASRTTVARVAALMLLAILITVGELWLALSSRAALWRNAGYTSVGEFLYLHNRPGGAAFSIST